MTDILNFQHASIKGHTEFQDAYIALRKKEQRVYTNEQVALLPDIDSAHVHYKEWQVRRNSCTKLVRYLERKNKRLSILEVGCGNGWLSSRLANIDGATVTGVDVNLIELQQAAAVFSGKANVKFTDGDIRDSAFTERGFDVIVFAASIQYFPSLREIIPRALAILAGDGEVHILDSIFYSGSGAERARDRTRQYYHELGFENMADFYFHHRLDELKQFNYKLLHDPAALKSKILNRQNPFFWVRITH